MATKRRHYQAAEKVAILRRHLVEKIPISDICDEYGLNPTQVYNWQKQLFENAATIFERQQRHTKTVQSGLQRQIDKLEAKLQQKNEVVAELLQEHVQLKKALGEP
jgi:transposase-like protein